MDKINKDIIHKHDSLGYLLNKENTILIFNLIKNNWDVSKDTLNDFFDITNFLYCIMENNLGPEEIIDEKEINIMNKYINELIEKYINNQESKKNKSENRLKEFNEEKIISLMEIFKVKTFHHKFISNSYVYENELYQLNNDTTNYIIGNKQLDHSKLFLYIFKTIKLEQIPFLSIEVIGKFIEYIIKMNMAFKLNEFKNLINNYTKISTTNLIKLQNKKALYEDIYKYIIVNKYIQFNLDTFKEIYNLEDIHLLKDMEVEIIDAMSYDTLQLNNQDELENNMLEELLLTLNKKEGLIEALQHKEKVFKDFSKFEEFEEDLLIKMIPIVEYNQDNIDYVLFRNNISLLTEFITINKQKIKSKDVFKIDDIDILLKILESDIININIKKIILSSYDNKTQIKISNELSLDLINYIIENTEITIEYDGLKNYKINQDQDLEQLKLIIDELLDYNYTDDGKLLCYLDQGIDEKNQIILEYVLDKLSDDLDLEQYVNILVNHIKIIENMYELIKKGQFKDEFNFLNDLLNNNFSYKKIPDKLNNKQSRKILQKICYEKSFKLTKYWMKKLNSSQR